MVGRATGAVRARLRRGMDEVLPPRRARTAPPRTKKVFICRGQYRRGRTSRVSRDGLDAPAATHSRTDLTHPLCWVPCVRPGIFSGGCILEFRDRFNAKSPE